MCINRAFFPLRNHSKLSILILIRFAHSLHFIKSTKWSNLNTGDQWAQSLLTMLKLSIYFLKKQKMKKKILQHIWYEGRDLTMRKGHLLVFQVKENKRIFLLSFYFVSFRCCCCCWLCAEFLKIPIQLLLLFCFDLFFLFLFQRS